MQEWPTPHIALHDGHQISAARVLAGLTADETRDGIRVGMAFCPPQVDCCERHSAMDWCSLHCGIAIRSTSIQGQSRRAASILQKNWSET